MVYADNSDNIIEWGSEEHIIPYISPWIIENIDFPDLCKRQKDGGIKKVLDRGKT